MTDITIQERYDDIAKRSGLSEEIVRRILKASRESMAVSLKRGQRATLPGICTMIPEVRNKLEVGADSMVSYIKVKATPSAAMESELSKLGRFSTAEEEEFELERQKQALSRLRFVKPDEKSFDSTPSIRTNQISALL